MAPAQADRKAIVSRPTPVSAALTAAPLALGRRSRRTHRRRPRPGRRRERARPWGPPLGRVAEAHLRHRTVSIVGLEEAKRLEAERARDERRGDGLQLDVVVT